MTLAIQCHSNPCLSARAISRALLVPPILTNLWITLFLIKNMLYAHFLNIESHCIIFKVFIEVKGAYGFLLGGGHGLGGGLLLTKVIYVNNFFIVGFQHWVIGCIDINLSKMLMHLHCKKKLVSEKVQLLRCLKSSKLLIFNEVIALVLQLF